MAREIDLGPVVGPQGPQGATGATGAQGIQGERGPQGATFTPAVTQNGVISWTNDAGRTNPQSVDLASAALNQLGEVTEDTAAQIVDGTYVPSNS